MPKYRCLMRGENFPEVLLDKTSPIGFFATRFVDADSASNAELAALDLLRRDQARSVPPESRTSGAHVFFEAIEELSPNDNRDEGAGFSFFVMGT